MLLHGRRRHLAADQLDVSRDMHRLDRSEAVNPLPLAPVKEFRGGACIGRARIPVADVDRETFEEAPGSRLPCPDDQKPAARPRGQCPAFRRSGCRVGRWLPMSDLATQSLEIRPSFPTQASFSPRFCDSLIIDKTSSMKIRWSVWTCKLIGKRFTQRKLQRQ